MSDIFVFDLDRTIWTCCNKFGQEIWAKQMLSPFTKVSETCIKDDVSSCCFLHNGIQKYLEKLSMQKKRILFLSAGGILDVEKEDQPSVKLLKSFDLYHFFDKDSFIGYKTMDKNELLSTLEGCIFFDDDPVVIERAKSLNIKVIDRNCFKDYLEGP